MLQDSLCESELVFRIVGPGVVSENLVNALRIGILHGMSEPIHLTRHGIKKNADTFGDTPSSALVDNNLRSHAALSKEEN
jgi:hypothetical protein